MDSTIEQVRQIRDLTVRNLRCLHIHLAAESQQLAERYYRRLRLSDSEVDWSVAKESLTEKAIAALRADADLKIDTSRITSDDVAVRVMSRLRPGRQQYVPCVDALVGGQWGSEGKGNIAYFLSSEYELLVRVGAPSDSVIDRRRSRHQSGYVTSGNR